MNELLREIQEDIQREKYLALWQRYGKYAVALAVALVLAVAGWKAWQAYDASRSEKATTALIEAVQNPSAESYEALSQTAPADIAAIAKLLQAEELAKTDKQAAVGLYTEVANSHADPALQQLGKTLGGTGKPDERGAFYQSHLERLGYDAIASNDLTQAKIYFTQILDSENIPASLRSRAEQVLAWLQAQPSAAK